MALDDDGNFYTHASDGFHIARLSPKGDLLEIVGGNGNQAPQGVAATVDGDNLWVATNNGVVRVALSTHAVTQFGRQIATPVPQQKGSSAPLGEFNPASSVAVDHSGNVYVVDSGNARVQVLSPGSGTWRAFGSFGDGPGQFNFPSQIAIGSNENVYVVDSGNFRIQKLTTSGDPVGQWRAAEWATDTYATREVGIAADGEGQLYVSDPRLDRIVRVPPGAFAPPSRAAPQKPTSRGAIPISPPLPACPSVPGGVSTTPAAVSRTPTSLELQVAEIRKLGAANEALTLTAIARVDPAKAATLSRALGR